MCGLTACRGRPACFVCLRHALFRCEAWLLAWTGGACKPLYAPGGGSREDQGLFSRGGGPWAVCPKTRAVVALCL